MIGWTSEMSVNCIQVHPRTPDEIRLLSACPDVAMAAEGRGVSQVLHFTTMRGAVGILASGAVKARASLPEDKYLEHIYRPNVPYRKDPQWSGYVNLSIERINVAMFHYSVASHAKENNPWVVLSFHSSILTHPGVVFTTTNNIYPACRRAEGLAGFNCMFAEAVQGRYDTVHTRRDQPRSWPTDRQAEVLYPSELSCKYLQRIDVQMKESLEKIEGAQGALATQVPVRHAPEVFK